MVNQLHVRRIIHTDKKEWCPGDTLALPLFQKEEARREKKEKRREEKEKKRQREEEENEVGPEAEPSFHEKRKAEEGAEVEMVKRCLRESLGGTGR